MSTDTIGASGQDFTTIALWAADVKSIGTLTEDEVGQLVDDANYARGAAADLDMSSLTLAGNTVTLEATTNKHDGDFGNGSRIVAAADFAFFYDAIDIILKDLSIENTGTSDFTRTIQATRVTAERCIFSNASSGTISNCLQVLDDCNFIACRTEGGIIGIAQSGLNVVLSNNTALNAPTGIAIAQDVIVRNNVAYGNTTDWSGSTTGTDSHNASDDGTHPGTSGVTLTSNPFEADGFTPSASGQLDGAGTNLSISLDAANNSYNNPPSIGAYEVIGGAAESITADSGSYTVTGTAIPLLTAFNTTADAGSYLITGTAIPLSAAFNVTTVSGNYLIAGTDIALTANFNLTAETDSYLITGTDIDLAGTETLTAESGSYSIAGAEAGLIAARNIVPETALYSISGADINLRFGSALVVESGSYSIAGTELNLTIVAKVTAAAGSYIITGTDVSLVTVDDIWIPVSKTVTNWTDEAGTTTTWTDIN